MSAVVPETRSNSDSGAGAQRLIEWLTHFQFEELKKVLERWKLSASDTHQGQLDTIGKALASGQISFTDPYALEAMRWITKLNLPEQREFLRRCGLPTGGPQIDVLRRIEDNLGPTGVATDTAFDYVDEQLENGEQHVFLFRQKPGRHQVLNLFGNRRALYEKLRGLRSLPANEPGDQEAVRDGLYQPSPRDALFFENLVESASPQLVASYWREAPHRVLYLKWIATREWHTVETVKRKPQRIELRERSANFFLLDSTTGNAEVRLQKLHGNPRRSLSDELELLKRQIGALIDWEDFLPVLIEPAIRRLLVSTRASVVNWKVSWTDSGKLGGGVDPEMVRSIFRRFSDYSALHLTARWLFEEQPGGGAATIKKRSKLNAKTNEVELMDRCSPHQVQTILADVRRGGSASLRVPQLSKMAKDEAHSMPVLQQIEIALVGQKADSSIDLGRLARESWLEEKQALAVAQKLARRFPEQFEFRLSGRCPKTNRVAQTTQGPVAFGALEEVPDSFRCLHDRPRRFQEHQTEGNLQGELIFHPEPQRPALLERIRPTMENWLGKSSSRLYINILALLLFTVPFVLIVLGTAGAFLWVGQSFGGGMAVSLTLAVPFGLVMLLEAGIVVKLLGDPATRMAVTILEKLTKIFDPRKEAHSSMDWPTVVHANPEDEQGATNAAEQQKPGG